MALSMLGNLGNQGLNLARGGGNFANTAANTAGMVAHTQAGGEAAVTNINTANAVSAAVDMANIIAKMEKKGRDAALQLV